MKIMIVSKQAVIRKVTTGMVVMVVMFLLVFVRL